MTDDLDTPLGGVKKKPGKKRRSSDKFAPNWRKLPWGRTFFGILVLLIALLAIRIILVNDPEGGRPEAEVAISTTRGNNELANQVASQPVGAAPTTAQPEVTSGGPAIITVDENTPDAAIGVAALAEFGVLPDLIEETQNGPIPRVSDSGDTAFVAYARASVTPQTANGKPLIAVVITGMGLNEGGTLDAIEKLPDNITLAFAPYGRNLQRTTNAARAGGHEIMLEVPLEPFDYPENDPGPQTLLTGQAPRANLDRLYWLLARMGGYTGVINHMGARFTSSATDFSPIMEELGTRGLAYLDDGGSNRSLASGLARSNKVPFARADIFLDSTPSRAAILTALEKLTKRARTEGHAIGIASALPVSITTIAEWARTLEDEGILLVPASALMATQ